MTVHVRSAPLPGSDVLRRLVLQSMDTFLCGPKVLETTLPWPGNPILVLDAKKGPVLISMDDSHPEQALVNGLSALELFNENKSILVRAYPSMSGRLSESLPHLIVIGQQRPVGCVAIQKLSDKIRCYQFRTIEVNGELGLLIDPVDELLGKPQSSRDAHLITCPDDKSELEGGLTTEEEIYFEQI